MTLTFGIYSLDALIARVEQQEARSCGMDENITNLLGRLRRIEHSGRQIKIESITLNEVELSLLGLL